MPGRSEAPGAISRLFTQDSRLQLLTAFDSITYAHEDASFHVSRPLRVSRSQGWEYSYLRCNPACVVHRPGWYGRGAGATLALQLDVPELSAGQQPALAIAYVRSYETFGAAAVQCLPPCACDPVHLDGFHDRQTTERYLYVLPLQLLPPQRARQTANTTTCQVSLTVEQQRGFDTFNVALFALVALYEEQGYLKPPSKE